MILIEKNTNKYRKILFTTYIDKEEDVTEFNIPKNIGILNIDYECIYNEGFFENSVFDYDNKVFVDKKYMDFENDISNYKQNKIEYYSNLSFNLRNAIVPDYRIQNMSIGVVYEEYTSEDVVNLIDNFKTEYYRIKGLIESATTVEEIDAIEPNFPTTI